MYVIHAVSAVFPDNSFNKHYRTYQAKPINYKCGACSFTGNLEQAVSHSVNNQFVVRLPRKEK